MCYTTQWATQWFYTTKCCNGKQLWKQQKHRWKCILNPRPQTLLSKPSRTTQGGSYFWMIELFVVIKLQVLLGLNGLINSNVSES